MKTLVDEQAMGAALDSSISAATLLSAVGAFSQLTFLFERGRGWADAWLAEHFDDLGERQTIDLDYLFADTFKPVDAIEDVLEEDAEPPTAAEPTRKPARRAKTSALQKRQAG